MVCGLPYVKDDSPTLLCFFGDQSHSMLLSILISVGLNSGTGLPKNVKESNTEKKEPWRYFSARIVSFSKVEPNSALINPIGSALGVHFQSSASAPTSLELFPPAHLCPRRPLPPRPV